MTMSTQKMTVNSKRSNDPSSLAQDAIIVSFAMPQAQPFPKDDVEAPLQDDQASTTASDATSEDEIPVAKTPQKSSATCHLLAGFGICMLIGGLLVKYVSSGEDQDG